MEIFNMLQDAAERQHVNLIKTNVELMCGLFDYDNINILKTKLYFFWDKDIRLQAFLKKGF